jgi:hypothetical protein
LSDRGWLRFVSRYTPPTNGDPLLATVAIRELPGRGAPPILLLGSSQVREELDCGPFERWLQGRSCYNLASARRSSTSCTCGGKIDCRTASRHGAGPLPQGPPRPAEEPFVSLETGCLLSRGTWEAPLDPTGDVSFGLLQAFSTLRYKDGFWDFYGVVRSDLEGAWELRMPPQPIRMLAQSHPSLPVLCPAPEQGRSGRRAAFLWRGPAGSAGAAAGAREAASQSGPGGDFPTRVGYESTLLPETLANHRRIMAGLARRDGITFVSRQDLPQLEPTDFLDFTHLSKRGRPKCRSASRDRGPARGVLITRASPAAHLSFEAEESPERLA